MSEATPHRLLLVRGGYSPIPLNGKVPVLLTWQTKTQTNLQEIELWDRTYPGALNTGMLTARNPTIDLDITDEEAARALEQLARELFEEHGPVLVRVGKWPKRAIPLRTDEPFKKIVRLFRAPNGTEHKIEVLGDGQQVVVCGIHPDTHEPYRWHGGELEDVPRADLPYVRRADMVGYIEAASRILIEEFGWTVVGERPAREANGAAPGKEDWGALLGRIASGDALHDTAASFTSKLAKAGLSRGAVHNLTLALYERSPGALARKEYPARMRDLGRMVDTAIDKYAPSIRTTRNADDADGAGRYKLIAAKDLRVDRVASYVVKGLIPRTGLVVVWGRFKSGKSFWTFDLGMHVAMGLEYRGRRVQGGTVVYCAFEGQGEFPKRVEALRTQYGAEAIDAAPFYLMPTPVDLIANHAALIADISAAQAAVPVMVVLDTLNRSLVGSESDDEDMSAYVKAADAIRDALGCVVVIVHHCGVSDDSRPRGHSSLSAADDVQLSVKRDTVSKNTLIVTVEHAKDGPEGDVLLSELQPVDLGEDNEGDRITSCTVLPLDSPVTPARTQKLHPGARLHLDALHACIAEHGRILAGNTMVPRDTKVVSVTQWREHCYATTIGDSDKPDAKRKAFQRAVSELQAARAVGAWNDWVWVVEKAGQYWHPGRDQ